VRYGRKTNLSIKNCSDISDKKITREIAQNAKLEVARNTRSCQKVAEQLVESPNPG